MSILWSLKGTNNCFNSPRTHFLVCAAMETSLLSKTISLIISLEHSWFLNEQISPLYKNCYMPQILHVIMFNKWSLLNNVFKLAYWATVIHKMGKLRGQRTPLPLRWKHATCWLTSQTCLIRVQGKFLFPSTTANKYMDTTFWVFLLGDWGVAKNSSIWFVHKVY